MNIGMGLPGINEDRILVCEWCGMTVDTESSVRPGCLDKNMAVVVGVRYERSIHLQQRESAKISVK